MFKVFRQKPMVLVSAFFALVMVSIDDVYAVCGKERYVCCKLGQKVNFGQMEKFLTDHKRKSFKGKFQHGGGEVKEETFKLDPNDEKNLDKKRSRSKYNAVCLAVVGKAEDKIVYLQKKKARRLCRHLGGTVDHGAVACKGKWEQKLTWKYPPETIEEKTESEPQIEKIQE